MSSACWRCGYPTVYSMAPPVRAEPGLSTMAQVVVIVSVFAVALLGNPWAGDPSRPMRDGAAAPATVGGAS